MTLGERKIFPLQVVVPYWELPPAAIGSYLDRLCSKGVREIAAFIPWRLFESDITHSLHRFLSACLERDVIVSLVVTPELGLHYPYSGFPKEFSYRSDWSAKSVDGDVISTTLPPNSFTLPSLHHPDVQKAYQTYVSRLSSFLSGWSRTSPDWASKVTLIVSGSLWKSYRSPWSSLERPFETTCGDRSEAAGVSYQNSLEKLFLSVEAEPELRSNAYEEYHRKAFDAESETLFRSRFIQALHRRDLTMEVKEFEIHVPEADPSTSYARLARGFSGTPCTSFLSKMIREIGSREGSGAYESAPPSVYFSEMGGFSHLPVKDRFFLVLQSIFDLGSRGGLVGIEAEDWLDFSPSQRGKIEEIAQSLKSGVLTRAPKAVVLVPQVWSGADASWQVLKDLLGSEAALFQYSKDRMNEVHSNLCIVDRGIFLTRDKVHTLLHWLQNPKGPKQNSPRTLVLPKSPFMTEGALEELKLFTDQASRIEAEKGLTFRLYSSKARPSHLVFSDSPEILLTQSELRSRLNNFFTVVASLSGISLSSESDVGDPHLLHLICNGSEVQFAFNPTDETDARGVPSKGIVPISVEKEEQGSKEDRIDGTPTRLESGREGFSPSVFASG